MFTIRQDWYYATHSIFKRMFNVHSAVERRERPTWFSVLILLLEKKVLTKALRLGMSLCLMAKYEHIGFICLLFSIAL
ncbi:hypothetical protein X975_16874, partial [Stegodyphus mimosarum]